MSRLDTLPDEITHIICALNRFPVSLLWEIEQKHARKKMEYFDKHVVDGWLFSRGRGTPYPSRICANQCYGKGARELFVRFWEM